MPAQHEQASQLSLIHISARSSAVRHGADSGRHHLLHLRVPSGSHGISGLPAPKSSDRAPAQSGPSESIRLCNPKSAASVFRLEEEKAKSEWSWSPIRAAHRRRTSLPQSHYEQCNTSTEDGTAEAAPLENQLRDSVEQQAQALHQRFPSLPTLHPEVGSSNPISITTIINSIQVYKHFYVRLKRHSR